MKEVLLSESLCQRIDSVYRKMEEAYDGVARQLNFSCEGCPDNCCDSYFLHHTYLEWAYLWNGVRQLPEDKQESLIKRAGEYVEAAKDAESKGERPQVMCPLNQEGLCSLYKHRLMVCRTHGVPSVMQRPDGQRYNFPGCFRCQEIVEKNYKASCPECDRTEMLKTLAVLENELLGGRRHLYPKVRLTIAEMLVQGPPKISTPHCER